jgi:hypothetical protein
MDIGSCCKFSEDLDLQLYLGGAVFVLPGPSVTSSLFAMLDAYKSVPDRRLHFFKADA